MISSHMMPLGLPARPIRLQLNKEGVRKMKASYEKPRIEFEEYELHTAIAAGCQTVISLGPGDSTHEICEEYVPDFRPENQIQPFSSAKPLNFYEDSCTCYLSAGEGTLMTS